MIVLIIQVAIEHIWKKGSAPKNTLFGWNGCDLLAKAEALLNDVLHCIGRPAHPRGHRVLAAMVDSNSNVSYAQTDANGNVMRMYSKVANLIAQFEYGPFGEMLRATGPAAAQCPIRYSSEYYDTETELYYYGHRYYSPRLGRWLSQDPIEEQGGINLYGFVGNNTPNKYDVRGLWGADVHNILTQQRAEQIGYPTIAAESIARANQQVDGGFFGPLTQQKNPIIGDQGYHFNTNIPLDTPTLQTGSMQDSRVERKNLHFKRAVALCSLGTDSPELAASELGYSLHPTQDIFAHGDYGAYSANRILATHNSASPQKNLLASYGNPVGYPDNTDLDAVGSPTGVPTYSALSGTSPQTLYAIYAPGTKRFQLTLQSTTHTLRAFRQQINGCKCLRYFGVR